MTPARLLLLTAVIASALAGCGSQTITVTNTVEEIHTVVRTVAARAPQRHPIAKHAPASSGSVLTVHDPNGNTLRVQANGVIDPATPANPSIDAPTAGRTLWAFTAESDHLTDITRLASG